MRKRILSVVLCVLLAGAGICGCSGGNTESADNEIEQQNSAAENNENTENNTVAEADNENNEIVFSTPYEIVECLGGYFISTSNDGKLYGVLDSKGETVVDFKYDELSFNNQEQPEFLYATLEGKYGTLDLSGNEIIPIEYSKIDDFENNNSYTIGRKGVDNIYVLSKTGEVVKDISDYKWVKQGNAVSLWLDSLISAIVYYDDEGNILTDNIQGNFTDFEVIIFDLDGNTLINNIMNVGQYCKNGTEIYVYNNLSSSDDAVSFIDKNGKITDTMSNFDSENYRGTYYSTDYCIVQRGQAYYLYNIKTGKDSGTVYNALQEPYNDKAFGYTQDNKLNILDESGNVINTVCEDVRNIELSPGVAIVSLDGETYRAYDLDGNDIFDDRFYDVSEHDGYYLLKNVNDQYALLSPYGKLLVDFGNITESMYMGQTIQNQVSSDDMYCICISNNGSNEVHAFYAK